LDSQVYMVLVLISNTGISKTGISKTEISKKGISKTGISEMGISNRDLENGIIASPIIMPTPSTLPPPHTKRNSVCKKEYSGCEFINNTFL
jgi:hypothetical protein